MKKKVGTMLEFTNGKTEAIMKTKLLLTAIFSLSIIINALANHVNTVLNLRMFDGRPISVTVDGVPQGAVCTEQVIRNLAPGFHRLKIFAIQRHPFGWNGSMTPVFRGSIEIFDGYATYAVIQRWNTLVVEDYEALFVPPMSPACPSNGHLPGYSPYPSGTNFPPGNNGFQGSNCSNSDYNGNGWNNWDNHGTGFRHPMSQDDFNQLLRIIESKSFESTKQEIAMGAIGYNYFKSEQVRQMLNLFSFESTRIEVAKRAYDKVVDPDRFYLVYDAFSFESSINDLQASLGR